MGYLWSKQSSKTSTKVQGDGAEDQALAHLQRAGLQMLARNFKTPGRGGGEVDLIMQEPDGTVVFVEVRLRRNPNFGGALASVDAGKRRRVVLAARHYLADWPVLPPCRFDVIGVVGASVSAKTELVWLKGAFEALA
jgi:putative endonuclease